MDEITPVFVCGMSRSGTTNTLRVLNTHPSVMLNSEIPLSILKHFFALLDTTENSYSEPERRRIWRENKARYIFDSFGYLAKGGRGRLDKAEGANFRGHKSPRLETFFEKYEAHFSEIGPPPRYFYCARNPFDCWRSHQSMPWSTYKTAQEFLHHYKASFAKLQQMHETAGARVFVLNLDELKGASDVLAFYREKIFAPLGLDLCERTAARLEKMADKRESSAAPALGADERDAIAREPGIPELLETYFPRSMSASL